MDIQQIVKDLLRAGFTQNELAELVPCSQSAISAFVIGARGSRPSLKIGLRLLELHKDLCATANEAQGEGNA